MKSSYVAKAGAITYTAFSAAQNWASALQESFTHPSMPGYAASMCNHGAKLGTICSATIALDRMSSTIEDLLPGGKQVRGLLPLAAATVGVGALINYFGNYIGIEEGHGVLETTKMLMSHYHDNAISMVTGNEPSAWYATGACVTSASIIRTGANVLGKLSRYADRKEAQRKADKD